MDEQRPLSDWTPERLRELAYERAGGSPSDANYDPELLEALTDAADDIGTLTALAAGLAVTVIDLIEGEPTLAACAPVGSKEMFAAIRQFVDRTNDSLASTCA